MLSDAVLDEYIKLVKEKRKLAEKTKAIKDKMAPIEEVLLEHFQGGTTQIKRGGLTLYLKRDVTVGSADGDVEALTDALRKARLGFLISPQWTRMKAWVKERCIQENGELNIKKLPPTIAAHVKIAEKFSIGNRKAWRSSVSSGKGTNLLQRKRA